MGIIPVPPVYGVDCLACHPAGETPSMLKVFFSGIKIGSWWKEEYGLPPNGYFDLQQSPGSPCSWYDLYATYPWIWYNHSPHYTTLRLKVALDVFAFAQTIAPICTNFFTSEFNSPEWWAFWGGTALVTTPAKMAEIIESVSPMIDPDPRMELFPMEDGKIAIRYAGKRDATNISFKFDTTA